MSIEDYGIYIATRALNTHQDKLEDTTANFNYTYRAVVDMFLDQLIPTTVQEDIHDDLIFEIQVYTERYSYNIDVEEMAKLIYKDFKIKGAE